MRREVLFTFFIIICAFPAIIGEKRDAFRGLPGAWNMIPARSLAGPYYLFKSYQTLEDQGLVKVSGPVVEITSGQSLGARVFKEGYSSEIDSEDFEEQQKLGEAVFEATSASGTNVATAFLVGRNLVLTNRHVMGPAEKNRGIFKCGKFSIKLNHREETLSCEKVRFCSQKFDYCLVQMNKFENGADLASEIKPLRLARNIKSNKDLRLLHIGNAAGLGIQASIGRGLRVEKGEFFHFTPTLNGSSGAPIFNDRGVVIGINWGHTGGNYIDETSFNRGVLSETIYRELKNYRPELIKEIKTFRSWFHRESSHRKVKIAESLKDRPYSSTR